MVSDLVKNAKTIREQHMIIALEEIEKVLLSPTDGWSAQTKKLDIIKDIIEAWRRPTQFATGAILPEKKSGDESQS
jgi:hypothetical protein